MQDLTVPYCTSQRASIDEEQAWAVPLPELLLLDDLTLTPWPLSLVTHADSGWNVINNLLHVFTLFHCLAHSRQLASMKRPPTRYPFLP